MNILKFYFENPESFNSSNQKKKRCENCRKTKKGCDGRDICFRCARGEKECIYSNKPDKRQKQPRKNKEKQPIAKRAPDLSRQSIMDVEMTNPGLYLQETYYLSGFENGSIYLEENRDMDWMDCDPSYISNSQSALTFLGNEDVVKTPKPPSFISRLLYKSDLRLDYMYKPPDRVQLRNLWSWCTRAKDSVPDGARQENRTWRIMGMMVMNKQTRFSLPEYRFSLPEPCLKAQNQDEKREWKDPLESNIWRFYTIAKDSLPDGARIENFIWRMMAKTLQPSKKSPRRPHNLFCPSIPRLLPIPSKSMNIPLSNEEKEYREKELEQKEKEDARRRSFYRRITGTWNILTE